MTIRRKVNPVLMLLSGGALFTACVPVTLNEYLAVSAPAAIPPGWRGEVDKNGQTALRLDGIDLRLDVRNLTGREKVLYLSPVPPFVLDSQSQRLGDPSRPLVIFLEFHPREGGFSFDPMAVRLWKDLALRSLTPRGFIGPGRPSGQRCLDRTGRELEERAAGEAFVLPPDDQGTCFVLAFGPSSYGFRVHLEGLSRSGKVVALPELRFERRPAVDPPDWVPAVFRTDRGSIGESRIRPDNLSVGAAAGTGGRFPPMKGPTEAAVWQALATITDPELPVSLVDMGMVYGVSVNEAGRADIEITFTSIGCPGMDMILDDIRAAVGAVPGVTGVQIDVVWSPPWTKSRLTPRGRRLLQAVGLSV
jgi:metal-sulfur cluster biosynthetic enzyme